MLERRGPPMGLPAVFPVVRVPWRVLSKRSHRISPASPRMRVYMSGVMGVCEMRSEHNRGP